MVSDSSEDESFQSDDGGSSQVSSIANKLIARNPDLQIAPKSKSHSIKSRLQKLSGTKTKSSVRIDGNKKIDDMIKDLQNSFSIVTKKLDSIIECMVDMNDRMTHIEDTVCTLQAEIIQLKEGISKSKTYSEVASISASVPEQPNNDRLDRLEFLSSEDERKKRILEAVVTDPDVSEDSSDLKGDITNIFSRKLGMKNRELDANMKVFRTNRQKTVRVILSDVRYKRFLYAARKKTRSGNNDAAKDLFIGENLTSYNYKILKMLKEEKKKREESQNLSFDSVYSLRVAFI